MYMNVKSLFPSISLVKQNPLHVKQNKTGTKSMWCGEKCTGPRMRRSGILKKFNSFKLKNKNIKTRRTKNRSPQIWDLGLSLF